MVDETKNGKGPQHPDNDEAKDAGALGTGALEGEELFDIAAQLADGPEAKSPDLDDSDNRDSSRAEPLDGPGDTEGDVELEAAVTAALADIDLEIGPSDLDSIVATDIATDQGDEEPDEHSKDTGDWAALNEDELPKWHEVSGPSYDTLTSGLTPPDLDEEDSSGEFGRATSQPRYRPPTLSKGFANPPQKKGGAEKPRYREPTKPSIPIPAYPRTDSDLRRPPTRGERDSRETVALDPDQSKALQAASRNSMADTVPRPRTAVTPLSAGREVARKGKRRGSAETLAIHPTERDKLLRETTAPFNRAGHRSSQDIPAVEPQPNESGAYSALGEDLDPKPISRDANTQRFANSLPPESATDVVLPQSSDAVSRMVFTSQTVELPTVGSIGIPDIDDATRRYLERLLARRPGPGGLGRMETLLCDIEPGPLTDITLAAQVAEVDGDGTMEVTNPRTDMVVSLVNALAQSPNSPVFVLGGPGSGKSHALNSLAGALAGVFLGQSAARNAFAGMTGMLSLDGAPLPIVIDLAQIATLGPATPEAMLSALVRAGDLPEEIGEFGGNAIVIADNLDIVTELGLEDFNPVEVITNLIRRRPGWRAVIATRHPGMAWLSWVGSNYGPLPLIELLPLSREQLTSAVRYWRKQVEDAPPTGVIESTVPATVSSNLRLLFTLLASWTRTGDKVPVISTHNGICGVIRLLVEAADRVAETRDNAVSHMADLQVLADVASGLPGGYVLLDDMHFLANEGYLRDSVDTLVSTGLAEIRIAKGDRPFGAVTFTHPLFQEVLLAEHAISDLIRSTLRDELKAKIEALPASDRLPPFSERQVQRLQEVVRQRVADLPEHLRVEIWRALSVWLRASLFTAQTPNTPHYPRLLGIAWFLAIETRSRLETPPERATLDEQARIRLQEILAQVGEESIRAAVAASKDSHG
ncbi:MAG: hypothetical protein KC561_04350 [Myxococcales bacterium]|nr:hypothetical protein [Myxococcales bacterium]